MRRFRSAVALVSTLAVMACQTAASVAGGVRPASVTASSMSPSGAAMSSHAPVVAATQTNAASFAAAGSSKRKTYIIAGIVVALIAVALLVAASGDGYGSNDY